MLLISMACLISAAELPAWEYISPDSLNSWINRSAIPFLVDVREHNEYLARHIPDVALYPYTSGAFKARYGNLPQGRPLVLICVTGGRSSEAANFLESVPGSDFSEIYVLQGGMNAWNHDVIVNDQSTYSQKMALCELFSTSSCEDCYIANLYLDKEFFYYSYSSESFTLPRYRIFFPEPMPENTKKRAQFYQIYTVPAMVINGTELINPLDLTSEKIFYSKGQPTQMMMEIYGTLESSEDSTLFDMRLELKAGPSVEDTIQYNLFILIIQDKITPDFWNPPFFPENGEDTLNGSVRSMVESDSGSAFTIQPGETRYFDRSLRLDGSYSIPECSVTSFVQDLKTHKIYQVNSRKLNDLLPFNRVPSVTSAGNQTSFEIALGGTLAVNLSIQDPDLEDKVTLSLDARYSEDGVTYIPYSSEEISLGDSTLLFKAAEAPAGDYRIDIVGTDRWGLSDTLDLYVSAIDTMSPIIKSCDFSGNTVVDAADVMSFLLLLRDDPQNPRLDWNGDGKGNITDAVALLLDILHGRCPSPTQEGGLLASTNDERYYRSVDPGSLDSEEVKWLTGAIDQMDIDENQREELLAEIHALSARAVLPRAFSLAQNVPNPFNPSTNISFSVPEGGADISLMVFDLRGRLVRVLIEGKRSGGEHFVFFDGRDNSGRPLPSGVYLYRLLSGEFASTRKMLLVK